VKFDRVGGGKGTPVEDTTYGPAIPNNAIPAGGRPHGATLPPSHVSALGGLNLIF